MICFTRVNADCSYNARAIIWLTENFNKVQVALVEKKLTTKCCDPSQVCVIIKFLSLLVKFNLFLFFLKEIPSMSNQFQVYEQKRKKNNKSKIRENSKLTCFYSFEKVKIRVCLCIMLCVNKLVFVYFSFFYYYYFFLLYFFLYKKKFFIFIKNKTRQKKTKYK